MSSKAATLLMGLLALAEGRSTDMNYLSEANREDVLDEISPELLDRIAYRLYAEEEQHLSAYERLLKDDKRKKMDYLNNIRPDLLEQDREEHAPARHHEDHQAIKEELSAPTDPTKESIRDKVLRESQRRQNDLMESKRLKDELSRADKERADYQEELEALSPEEREQKKLHDKWRREFEREQHKLAEEEDRMRKSNDLARYQDEMARKEKDEARKAREELRKQIEEEERHQNDLMRKQQDEQTKAEREQARKEKEARKKAKDKRRKEKDRKKKRQERQLKEAEQIIRDRDLEDEQNRGASERDRKQQQTERMADRIAEDEAVADKEHRRRLREQRREAKAEAKRQQEEQVKREEEAYRMMLEEEHRHEEKLHRSKQRALDREKKKEDRRRKQWEEYEKCIERQVERSEDLDCEEPHFHHHHHHDPDFRRAVSEDDKDFDEREDLWSEDEEPYASEDYDYLSPFNGGFEETYQPENDLMPRSFEELKQPKQKKPVKKPIEETRRDNNGPWMNLVADDYNDINFDVDQHFKFRMPVTENYKGRDVKFNVKLPQDLLGGSASPTPGPSPGPTPTPPAPTPGPPTPSPSPPDPQPPSPSPPSPSPDTPPAPKPGPDDPKEVPDKDAPIGLYGDYDYGDEYYDEEDDIYDDELYYDEDGIDAYSTTPGFDYNAEYEQFAEDTQYWGRYDSPDYMLENQVQDPLMQVPRVLEYRQHHKHQDDYFLDHRHHMTQAEMMHDLQLDPSHFHTVKQEPVHHEQPYWSEDDASDYSDMDSDDYYEHLIGHKYADLEDDIGFSSDSNGLDEYEYNDIQFSINEDVQFKLSTSDNYEGRDIDVGIVMPGDMPKSTRAPQAGGQPASPEMALYADPPSHYGQTTTPYAAAPAGGHSPYMAGYQTTGTHTDRDYGYGRGMDYDTGRQRQFDTTAYPAAHLGHAQAPAGQGQTYKQQRKQQKRQAKLARRQARYGAPPTLTTAAPSPFATHAAAPSFGQPAIPPSTPAPPRGTKKQRRRRRQPRMDAVQPAFIQQQQYEDFADYDDEEDDLYYDELDDQEYYPEPYHAESELAYGQHMIQQQPQQPMQQAQQPMQQPIYAPRTQAPQQQQPVQQQPMMAQPQQPIAQQPQQKQQRRRKRRQQQQPQVQQQPMAQQQQPQVQQQPQFDYDSQMAGQQQQPQRQTRRQRRQRQQPKPQVQAQMPMQQMQPAPQQQPPLQQPMMGVPTGQQQTYQQQPQQQRQRRAVPQQQPFAQAQQPQAPQQQEQQQPRQKRRRQRKQKKQQPVAQPQPQVQQQQPQLDAYGRPIQHAQIPRQQPLQQPHQQKPHQQPLQQQQPQYQPDHEMEYFDPYTHQTYGEFDTYGLPTTTTQGELMHADLTAYEDADDDDYYGDEYDSEMDDEMYDMSQLMYQDGILEDDISENARYHGGRRHRRARKSQHRYPHHTHQRRETEHSFADQGATHFGQQHPYHTAAEIAKDLAQVGHQHAHQVAQPATQPAAQPMQGQPQQRRRRRKQQRPPQHRQRRRRHMVWGNDEDDEDDSSSSSSDDDDNSSTSESNFGFTSDDEEPRHKAAASHPKTKKRHALAHPQTHPRTRQHRNALTGNQYGLLDDDEDYYYEDVPMDANDYGLYYDELDDDDYYLEDVADDLMDNSDSSSSSSSSSSDDDVPVGPTGLGAGQEVEINVEITEKKNDIIEIPHYVVNETHAKVDNDMESSDLGFSDDANHVDEHAYQIERTGEFQIEQSQSSQEAHAINKEMSVDFSEGYSDFSDFSHEGQNGSDNSYSYYSNDSEANEMSDDAYLSSYGRYSDEYPEDDFSRFADNQRRYKRHDEPRLNQEAPPAPTPPAPTPAPPAPTPAADSDSSVSDSSSMSSSSSSSSSTSSVSSSSSSSDPAANGISNHLVPKVPKQPKQPANVWHLRGDELQTLYGYDDEDLFNHRTDLGEHDFWKRRMLNVDDYQHNLSYDDNATRGDRTLKPRTPAKPVNDKSKNKRPTKKPEAKTLGLAPTVDEHKFQAKKGSPVPTAFQGHTKKQMSHQDVYRHPQALGTPLKHIPQAKEDYRYQPRKEPRVTGYGPEIESEDLSFNFKKSTPVQGHSQFEDAWVKTLHDPHVRMPDEFHNYRFEREHPDLVQPAFFDHYTPHTEGMYGAGFDKIPASESTRFTPGHLAEGDLGFSREYSHPSGSPYHVDFGLKDHVEDERLGLDLYMPGFTVPKAPEHKTQKPLKAVKPAAKTQPVKKAAKTSHKAQNEDYFTKMFQRQKHTDSIGDLDEQEYMQTRYPHDEERAVTADSRYLEYMYDTPHYQVPLYDELPPIHHKRSHDFDTTDGYPTRYEEGWGHVDPSHGGYYLQSQLTPAESEYLALYGASELFGQLADMPERRPRKKRSTPSRNGIYYANSDSEDSTDESSATPAPPAPPAPETPSDSESASDSDSDSETPAPPAPTPPPANLVGYQMNLFGSGELMSQLQSENGLERAQKRWTPHHKRRDEFDHALLQ